MYDEELFRRICSVSCSLEELKDVVKKLCDINFDLDNPFDKYYDICNVKLVVDKYERKEISYDYVANWATVYDWILNGGFKLENRGVRSLKSLLVYETTDWLDALSFFDGGVDSYDLNYYIEALTTLDSLYQDADHCKAMYVTYPEDEEEYGEIQDAIVLIYNDVAKTFAMVLSDAIDPLDIDIPKMHEKQLEAKEKQLLADGYTKLTCGNWEKYWNKTYDEEMVEKICSVSCTLEELEKYEKIYDKGYDEDKPFEEYYDVNTIILAIDKCKRGEMSPKHFAYWLQAYLELLSSSIKIDVVPIEDLGLYLSLEITEWLDNLSCYHDGYTDEDLEAYKNTFIVFDLLYQDREECSFIFAPQGDCAPEDYDYEDIITLVRNDKKKYFMKIYSEFIRLDDERMVEITDLREQVEKLKGNGYKEHKYHYCYEL